MTGPVAHGLASAGTRATDAEAAAAAMDRRVARVLRAGVRASVVLLAAGAILLLAQGRSPLDEAWPPLNLSGLVGDLLALHPEGFLWLGLLVILATPSLRVLTAVIGFVATGERRMAALGVIVLVIVALAVVAGTALG